MLLLFFSNAGTPPVTPPGKAGSSIPDTAIPDSAIPPSAYQQSAF